MTIIINVISYTEIKLSFLHSFIHSYNFIIHLFCKIMSGINFMHQMQWFPLTTIYPKNSKSKYPPLNSFPSYFLNSIIKSWKYLKISSFSDVNKVYFLKVSKSLNQFMMSSILPKKEWNCKPIPLMRTRFSLCIISNREKPAFITGIPAKENRIFPVWKGLQCILSIFCTQDSYFCSFLEE